MKVIVPCCGRSERFPNLPPKWMLPGPDGRTMLAMAVEGLDVAPKGIVVVVLAEHVERFDAVRGIEGALGAEVRVVVLEEQTASEVETVARALQELALDEPFLVKDSDNRFTLGEIEQPVGYVSVDSLQHHDLINPGNKSYLQVDHNGAVINIREKVVVSDLFSVGGYFFTEPAAFLAHFDRLDREQTAWAGELYISDVIGSMVLEGSQFTTRTVEDYADWGTLDDWERYLSRPTSPIGLGRDGHAAELPGDDL